MNQLAVVIGILLAYVLGLRAFELGWRNLALVGVLPSATLLLSGLLWLPGANSISRRDQLAPYSGGRVLADVGSERTADPGWHSELS